MKNKKQGMAIEEVLNWFDSEIEFVDKELFEEASKTASNAVTMVTLTGIKGYLSQMKQKLVDASFENLDKKS